MKPGVLLIAAVNSVMSFFVFLYETRSSIADNTGILSANEQIVYDNCSFNGVKPEVISTGETDTTQWHGRFDLPNLPHIWEPVKHNEHLLSFRKKVHERIGRDIDSRKLTERQRAIFMALPDEYSGEAANSTLLLNGDAGAISDMSCLEMMLWTWMDARYSMIEHPAGFGAFALQGHGEVRTYLSSAYLVGVKMNRKVSEQIQTDIVAEYRMITLIHNHPFLFDREVSDRMWTIEATKKDTAGALAPSTSDAGFYLGFRNSHGLEETWITNGFRPSRFSAAEFDILAAR